jgi:hypothetical protein
MMGSGSYRVYGDFNDADEVHVDMWVNDFCKEMMYALFTALIKRPNTNGCRQAKTGKS